MDEETLEHKQYLLAIYQDNLRVLEVQAAFYGLTPPLQIVNQINYHQQQIKQLRLTLETNAQEVSFDSLLLTIRDLQRYVQEESQRTLLSYHELLRDAEVRGFLWSLGVLGCGYSIGMGKAA